MAKTKKRKMLKYLYLFLVISVMLYPMGVDAAARQGDSRFRIRIIVGNQDFSAELYDNETTRAWVGQMPMTLEMSELNGNEKYHYFSESLPTNPEIPDAIHTGDLMLYGQSYLVLFYKDFVTSYSYTPLGYMEDAAGLAETLGDGNVTVSFRLDDVKLPDGKDEPSEQPSESVTEQPSEVSTEQPSEVSTEQSEQKQVKVQAIKLTGKMANKKLVWSTSNKKYATVNVNGKVTAKKAGRGKTVLITAKATDGSGKKASIKIRIKS